MRPAPSRQSAAASLWICQCSAGRGRVVLLQPVHADVAAAVRGSFVNTDGSVMYGPPSPGQQVGIGRRSRSGRSSTISWQGPLRTVFGARVGERLELPERAHLVAEALRRLQLEHRGDLLAELVEPLDAEGEAHAALRAELVDQQRERRAAHVAEEQRGAAGLDDAVGDLADLEVRVDLGRDLDQLALAPEQVDPLAQVVADHEREASGCPPRGSRAVHAVRRACASCASTTSRPATSEATGSGSFPSRSARAARARPS